MHRSKTVVCQSFHDRDHHEGSRRGSGGGVLYCCCCFIFLEIFCDGDSEMVVNSNADVRLSFYPFRVSFFALSRSYYPLRAPISVPLDAVVLQGP